MSPSPLAIRTAEAGDLAALLALYKDMNPGDPAIDPAVAQERFASMLAYPGMRVLVGVTDDALAASVTLIIMPNLTRGGAPYALIENVATATPHRRRGYASALIAHAIELAWQAGCYKVMLLTGRTDPGIHRFYESCGFVQNKTGFQIRRSV
jgi:GNAT superfamily N-acetyltransferase